MKTEPNKDESALGGVKPRTVNLIQELTAASIGPKAANFGDYDKDYVMVPPGWSFLEVEQELASPRRIENDVTVSSIDAFCGYFNEFSEQGRSIIWQNHMEGNIFEAVLDYHMKDSPAWCLHNLALLAKPTPEFSAWNKSNDVRVCQRGMIEFLEDNAECVISDLAPIFQAISNLKMVATTGSHSHVKTNSDEVSTNASRTVSGENELPSYIDLALPIWQNMAPYKVRARLKINVTADSFYLRYKLINIEGVINHMLSEIRDRIEADTGFTVFA